MELVSPFLSRIWAHRNSLEHPATRGIDLCCASRNCLDRPIATLMGDPAWLRLLSIPRRGDELGTALHSMDPTGDLGGNEPPERNKSPQSQGVAGIYLHQGSQKLPQHWDDRWFRARAMVVAAKPHSLQNWQYPFLALAISPIRTGRNFGHYQ